MPATYHVFGACSVWVAVGSANAYVFLGITEEGGQWVHNQEHLDVKTDAAAHAPADIQILGETATIPLKLSTWDPDVLALVRLRSVGNTGGVIGQSGPMGTLLGTGGHAHGLFLPSATDLPWVFPKAILRQRDTQSLSTTYGKQDLEFFAWRYFGPEDINVGTKALYSNTAPF